jgi:hypothetical protein
MSAWTHPQCTVCWSAANPGRQPYRMLDPEPETCCWCGQPTQAGIYVRENPDIPPRCPRRHEP